MNAVGIDVSKGKALSLSENQEMWFLCPLRYPSLPVCHKRSDQTDQKP